MLGPSSIAGVYVIVMTLIFPTVPLARRTGRTRAVVSVLLVVLDGDVDEEWRPSTTSYNCLRGPSPCSTLYALISRLFTSPLALRRFVVIHTVSHC